MYAATSWQIFFASSLRSDLSKSNRTSAKGEAFSSVTATPRAASACFAVMTGWGADACAAGACGAVSTAAGAAAPAPASDFTVCFLEQPVATNATTRNASAVYFHEPLHIWYLAFPDRVG